ncbi:CrcB family protein [Natrinema versiforme]|uniref:Fluoride-specific ion channel FluC n=1 Tax=Natrinema versiforme JCM 10478 TaxID=1227496 RepID=L9XWE9_9EURY|nr:CrcB family protein [Natrinema versiforme]ELY64938.1 Camphor resistance CrcB protein [Natrinema versiforme JCM 10478]
MTDAHPLVRLETLALIAVGGFAGSNLRFFAMGALPDVPSIVLVNAVGSAALAFLVYEAEYAGYVGPRARLVFTTGFLSSLTTYSTFALQAALVSAPLALLGIVAANYGLGAVGVLVGRALARRIGEPRSTGGEAA